MKKILKVIFIIIIIIGIWFGKKYIDYITFNYKEVVDENITLYFMNGDITYLNKVGDLLDDYQKSSNILYNIQNYVNSSIWDWLLFIDDKYVCDKYNLNSCEAQYNDFNLINGRLQTMYEYKSSNNNPLLLVSGRTSISKEVEKKMLALDKIIKNSLSSNPLDSVKINEEKCGVALECSRCYQGICSCNYIHENGYIEAISCKDSSFGNDLINQDI